MTCAVGHILRSPAVRAGVVLAVELPPGVVDCFALSVEAVGLKAGEREAYRDCGRGHDLLRLKEKVVPLSLAVSLLQMMMQIGLHHVYA